MEADLLTVMPEKPESNLPFHWVHIKIVSSQDNLQLQPSWEALCKNPTLNTCLSAKVLVNKLQGMWLPARFLPPSSLSGLLPRTVHILGASVDMLLPILVFWCLVLLLSLCLFLALVHSLLASLPSPSIHFHLSSPASPFLLPFSCLFQFLRSS